MKNDRFLKDFNSYHWTTESCSIQVKIQNDGLIAVVHAPNETVFVRDTTDYPKVQSHVNAEKTVSYFNVEWNYEGDVCAGDVSHLNIYIYIFLIPNYLRLYLVSDFS